MLKFKIKHNVTLDPGAFSPPATLLLNPVHTGLIINNITLPLREGYFPFYPFLQKTQKKQPYFLYNLWVYGKIYT